MDNNLEVRPGDKILPKWNDLVRWIRRQQVQAPGARITYTAQGARVAFSQPEYIQTVHFRVNLVSQDPPKVTVDEGTINGIIPKVNGIPIIGDKQNPPPKIDLLTTSDINAIQMICIETTHKPDGSLDQATIVAKLMSEIPSGMNADMFFNNKGYVPIGLVRMDPETGKVASIYQHTVHNLQVRMYPSAGGKRVIYWPV